MFILTNPKHLNGCRFIIYVTEDILVSSQGLTRPSVWSHLLTMSCRFTLLRRKSSVAARKPSGLGSALSWLLWETLDLCTTEAAEDFKMLKLTCSSNRLWALHCMQISTFSGQELNEDTFYVQTEWRFRPFKFREKTKVSQTNKQNKPQSAADTLQSSAVRLFNRLLVLKTTPKEARLPVKREAITS